MFRYILQRSLTYLVMVFITTTMGYFAAVTALKPALLEQEKVPKPSPEQVNRNFASLGLDPEMNPWDRYVQWLTNVVTKFDWGRSPNGAYINQEFGQRVWVSTRLLLVATILSIVIGIALGAVSYTHLDVYKRQGIASATPLKQWCRLYREGGAQALKPKPKGRPKGSVRAVPPTREEELAERVRKLEAQVAYLKKSIALKAQKRSQTGTKP